jgi:hypothetical protein
MRWISLSSVLQVGVICGVAFAALVPEQSFEHFAMRADNLRCLSSVTLLLIGGAGLWWERKTITFTSVLLFCGALVAAIILPGLRPGKML